MMKRIWSAMLAVCLMCAAVPSVRASAALASASTSLEGASENKQHNIQLAADAIDGTTVPGDGGFFSFNDTVGPRTSSYGYKNAPNGRGVKVTGGGVAQVASTLYLALKQLDGISYDELQTYSKFTDDYVSSKKDAILVDHKAGTDFSFYNNTGSAFTIELWVGEGELHCMLSATDDAAPASVSSPGFSSIALSGNDALMNNVMLAAESIYDTALKPGDEFSFNAVVGPRTERYGYQVAVDARGKQRLGGGAQQVASALYLAVEPLKSVSILEKEICEGYNQRYVRDADDAIEVDLSAGVDFRFRYDGDGSLNLYTYVSGGTLFCDVEES